MASTEPMDTLNIVVVYQDSVTLEWAMQQAGRAERKLGMCARSSWWKVHHLEHPEIRFDAIQATKVAHLIMVSVLAAEDSAPGFQEWIDGWLACRPQHEGTLHALIGVPEPAGPRSAALREHLRAVADRAQLDYVVHERSLPGHEPVPHTAASEVASFGVPVSMG